MIDSFGGSTDDNMVRNVGVLILAPGNVEDQQVIFEAKVGQAQ